MSYLHVEAVATKSDMDGRFDAVDQRFEQVDRRLDGLEHHFERLEGSFVRLADKVTGDIREVNGRLDRLFPALVTTLIAMFATVLSAILLL